MNPRGILTVVIDKVVSAVSVVPGARGTTVDRNITGTGSITLIPLSTGKNRLHKLIISSTHSGTLTFNEIYGVIHVSGGSPVAIDDYVGVQQATAGTAVTVTHANPAATISAFVRYATT